MTVRCSTWDLFHNLLLTHILLLVTVVIIGLSSLVYQVTEGPSAVVTVCATIQLGSVGREVAINLTTQVTGPGAISTGMVVSK